MTISWDFNHRYSLVYKSVGNVGNFLWFSCHGGDKNDHADRGDLGGENKYKCQFIHIYIYETRSTLPGASPFLI